MAMTLVCNKNRLQDALGLAVRAVSTRTTQPILECVLLTANQEVGLTLTASNLEISIETAPMEADIAVPGSIALDAKLFSEIVRKMPGEFVSITVDGNTQTVEVKSGRSRLNIVGQPGDEFPLMAQNVVAADSSYRLNNQVVKDMIRQTIFSVSTDVAKPALMGELIEVKEDTMRVVAVDMFRIAYKSTPLPPGATNVKAIVPAKAIGELGRMLPVGEDDFVDVQLTGKQIVFKASTFTLTSNLIEGEFIKYDQIFNEDFITVVEINRVSLLEALERAILIATENKMLPIKIQIEDENITIRAENERGETEDDIPCKTDGKPLNINFNPRYFIDILRAIDDENVVLKFNTQLSPCTIRGVDDDCDFKYLIVPLRQ